MRLCGIPHFFFAGGLLLFAHLYPEQQIFWAVNFAVRQVWQTIQTVLYEHQQVSETNMCYRQQICFRENKCVLQTTNLSENPNKFVYNKSKFVFTETNVCYR